MSLLHELQAAGGTRQMLLGELAGTDGLFIDGDWVESKDQDPNGDVRLIQLADVGDGSYRDRSARYLTSSKAKELGCTYLREGDLLIARMPDPLGRACIFPGDDKASVTVVDVCIFRSGNGSIDHRWLMHRINSLDVRGRIASLEAGTTRKRISRKNLGTIKLTVPPLNEQRTIVNEIETQLSRLEAGVSALKRAQANLKRYRAAVLKAACEGRLVPTEAELSGGIPYETGSELRERVLLDRRASATKKGWREPQVVDRELPELPAGWAWATLDEVGQENRPIIYGIIKPGPHDPDGVPYVRVTEMKNGQIDMNSLRKASPARAAKFARATLVAGDLLISKDGTIGKVALVPPELAGGNITQHVMRAPIHQFVNRHYVVWAVRSEQCQLWLKGETKGVALQGVNVEDFRRLPLPLPPLAEQERIVAEVERRLSVVDELEATLTANLRRATRLRQSVLQSAFSGGRPND